MVVKITPKFTADQIKKRLDAKIQNIHKAYFDELQRIGEAFVARARENDTYKDRTGNLRNSIGYIIMENGKQRVSNFNRTAKPTEPNTSGKEGTEIGTMKAEEIARSYPKGYVLVCVAGMNYAVYVESKGFDVITASSIAAKNELKEAIYEIYKVVNK